MCGDLTWTHRSLHWIGHRTYTWHVQGDDRMMRFLPLDPTEDEIRLVRVDCTESRRHELISNVALRKGRQRFVALSYPWGDGPEETTLHIDGEDVRVSDNLGRAIDALVRFWTQTYGDDGPRLLLWCDQICIDQGSDEEKNHQVAFMNEIYRRADTVLIWLPVPEGTRGPSAHWSQWREWHEQQLQKANPETPYAKTDPMVYVRAYRPTLVAWANVKAIVRSPWWSRAWVYQEFMLATTAIFLIDGLAVSWIDLRNFLTSFFVGIEDYKRVLDSIKSNLENHLDEAETKTAKLDTRREKLFRRIDQHENGFQHRCYRWNRDMDGLIVECWPPGPSNIRRLYDNVLPSYLSNGRVGHGLWHMRFLRGLFAAVIVAPLCLLAVAVRLLIYVPQFLCFCVTLPCSRDRLSAMEAEWLELGRSTDASRIKDKDDRKELVEDTERLYKNLSDARLTWDVVRSILATKNETASGSPMPLSRLVKHARNCNCKDPRDKIFAFLGLADPSYGIAADYRSSNTLNDVLTEATVAIIRTENSLNVFDDAREVDTHPRVIDHLPSWVSNFTRSDRQNSEYTRFIDGIGLPADCRASGSLKPVVEFSADRNGNRNRVLKCRGTRLCRLNGLVTDSDYQKAWFQFESDDGMIVKTSRAARVGDEIWTLFGSDVPFCLSKPSTKDPYYQLVGQASLWKENKQALAMNRTGLSPPEGEDILII